MAKNNEQACHETNHNDHGHQVVNGLQEGDEVITIKQASVLLGVSLDTLRNMDRDGRLKSFRRSSTSFRREYLLSQVLGLVEEKTIKTKSGVRERVTYADLVLGMNKSVLSGKKEDAITFADKIKKFLMTECKSSLTPSEK